MCVTFWGFVIQKIIGEDDSNLTNTVETMLKPPTIVRECELFKETRFISDQSLQLKDALNGRHGGLDDGKKTLNPICSVQCMCPARVEGRTLRRPGGIPTWLQAEGWANPAGNGRTGSYARPWIRAWCRRWWSKFRLMMMIGRTGK